MPPQPTRPVRAQAPTQALVGPCARVTRSAGHPLRAAIASQRLRPRRARSRPTSPESSSGMRPTAPAPETSWSARSALEPRQLQQPGATCIAGQLRLHLLGMERKAALGSCRIHPFCAKRLPVSYALSRRIL
jgi:hypothetical protein